VAACAIGITLLDFDVKRQTITIQIMSMPPGQKKGMGGCKNL
jgi:hypothetical protein